MSRLFLPVLLFAMLAGAGPLRAEDLAPEERAAQTLAIATAVQEQLLACWSLPSGYENRSISVRLSFTGDGNLDQDPYIVPESLRTAGKYPVLMRSVATAIETCLPFSGLDALGALPGERFDITVHFQS